MVFCRAIELDLVVVMTYKLKMYKICLYDLRKHLAIVTILVINFMLRFFAFAPMLFGDDWSQVIGQYIHQQLQWIDWGNRRPLLDAPLLILYNLFGLNVTAFYVVMYLLQAVAAVQLFAIIRRLLPERKSIALLTTALFLFHPADYSRIWLTMVGIWVVWVLVLIYAWCLLEYAEHGRKLHLFIGLVSLLLSLGIYEAQLGIAILWAILLFGLRKSASRQYNPVLLSPFLIGIVYGIWRMYGIGRIGVADIYVEQVQFSPSILLGRLFTGFKVLIWAWIEPFRRSFGGGPDFSFTYFANWRYYLVIAGVILLGWMMVLLVGRNRSAENALSKAARLREIRTAVVLCVIGGLFVVAGYLPIVAVFSPNLSGRFSRVNLFALPGASLVTVAVLHGVAVLLARYHKQINMLLVASVIPLLIVGMVTQVWIQHDARVAWQEQKEIWNQLFDLAPDLEDDTKVIFVLTGYEERVGFVNWQRTPLTSQWEVNRALQVLYGKQNVSADLFFRDLDSKVELRPDGVASLGSGNLVPYASTIFLIYEGEPRVLRLVEDLQVELALDFHPMDYAPTIHILDVRAPSVAWRILVDD